MEGIKKNAPSPVDQMVNISLFLLVLFTLTLTVTGFPGSKFKPHGLMTIVKGLGFWTNFITCILIIIFFLLTEC